MTRPTSRVWTCAAYREDDTGICGADAATICPVRQIPVCAAHKNHPVRPEAPVLVDAPSSPPNPLSDTRVPRPVPPAMWGRDHYSVFAYAGHVAHSERGMPDREKMRAKVGSPMQTTVQRMLDRDVPTRLSGGVLLAEHDDYDCAEDLIAARLLRNRGTGAQPVWELTRRGLLLWSMLVATHKSTGSMARIVWTDLCALAGVPVEPPPLEPRKGWALEPPDDGGEWEPWALLIGGADGWHLQWVPKGHEDPGAGGFAEHYIPWPFDHDDEADRADFESLGFRVEV